MVCPHAVIRIKVYDSKELQSAPSTFKTCDARDKEWAGMKYTIQVAPEDCTGCGVCGIRGDARAFCGEGLGFTASAIVDSESKTVFEQIRGHAAAHGSQSEQSD